MPYTFRLLLPAFALCVIVWTMRPAAAQIPPGFEVIQVTQSEHMDYRVAINNRRQIVFTRRWEDHEVSEDIFLYDGNTGELTQLTNDLRDLGYHVRDDLADINDDGVIVWSRYIGPDGPYGPTAEIMIRMPEGSVTRFTDNPVEDLTSALNSAGHFCWSRRMADGCRGGVYDVFFYDGQGVRQITDDAIRDRKVNQSSALNDLDLIVWSKYDFCVDPWESWIWLWRQDESAQLTFEQRAPVSPDINNSSIVAWSYRGPNGVSAIQLWQEGRTTTLTDWGTSPRLNDHGDVAFHRWHADSQLWQQWYYRAGQFWQLAEDPWWNHSGYVNELGEVAWVSGPVFSSDIRYLRRFDPGDLNCDRQVNSLDISAFILALFDQAEYGRQHPTCDPLLGDFNDDGRVNALDIDGFIDQLFR